MNYDQAERLLAALERISEHLGQIERCMSIIAGDTDYADVSIGSIVRAIKSHG